MNSSKMTEYLAMCVDLEKNKKIQEKIIKDLNSEINACQQIINKNMALVKRNKQINRVGQRSNIRVDSKGEGWKYAIIIYTAIIAFLGVFGLYSNTGNILFSICLPLISWIVVCLLSIIVWNNIKKNREYEAQLQAMRLMRQENEVNPERLNEIKVNNAKLSNLNNEKSKMVNTYNTTCRTLQSCYSLNIIPVKYRSIIPVAMFYDYFVNKRTYSLYRDPTRCDEGAINMYHEDLKHWEILQRFDSLEASIWQLGDKLESLRTTVQQIGKEQNEILRGIRTDVKDYFKITQYRQQQMLDCQRYSNWLQTREYYGY